MNLDLVSNNIAVAVEIATAWSASAVKQPRVLVVGDVIDDILATISMPLRHNTDTPASIVKSSGGSAANTAVWLASSGSRSTLLVESVRVTWSDFLRSFEKAGVAPHLVARSRIDLREPS